MRVLNGMFAIVMVALLAVGFFLTYLAWDELMGVFMSICCR